MEMRKEGNLEEAALTFAALQADVKDYVPQYLMHGQVLVALGRLAEAKVVMEEGVLVAAQKGDSHAGSELKAALDELI